MSSYYGGQQEQEEQQPQWDENGNIIPTHERHSQPRNQVHYRSDIDEDVEELRKRMLPY